MMIDALQNRANTRTLRIFGFENENRFFHPLRRSLRCQPITSGAHRRTHASWGAAFRHPSV